MRRIRVTATVVAAAFVLAGCDSDRRAISRDDLPAVPDEPQHVVEIDATGFDPDTLDVRTDELVELQNVGRDEIRVHAGARLDTGALLPGETTIVVFDDPGIYELELDDADDRLVVTSVEAPDS